MLNGREVEEAEELIHGQGREMNGSGTDVGREL